jgi:FKBP-type peptidyl-prolyl cis-trans isomerase (trigger factor)
VRPRGDATPITPGVLEGLDRFLALNPRPDTQAEIAALKKRYSDRASHEARARSAREEAEAAEAALLAHGHPNEPVGIVDEEILEDMDSRLANLNAARAKFREG